jgi:hypothetical protein
MSNRGCPDTVVGNTYWNESFQAKSNKWRLQLVSYSSVISAGCLWCCVWWFILQCCQYMGQYARRRMAGWLVNEQLERIWEEPNVVWFRYYCALCLECLNKPANSRVDKVPADPMARGTTGQGAPVLQNTKIYYRIFRARFLSSKRGQYSEFLLYYLGVTSLIITGEVSITELGAPDRLPIQISTNILSSTNSIPADIWTWSLVNK